MAASASPSSRHVIGACPLDCPDACSWIVTVDDAGQPVKLRGNPDHPFTRGGLCVKVNPYLEWAAQPDRLLHPLRRVGTKGEGRFQRISWDDALGEIAANFRQVIDEWGGEAIWPYAGTGTVGFLQGTPGAGKRLFHHLGASRHLATICSVSGHVGMSYTTGTAAGMDPEDLQHSDLIVLWGTNTLTSNQHLWPFIEKGRAAGAEVVVIDPVRTRTAARADRHLQLRPGTDGALAFGVMAELGRLTGWDETWLAANTLGWEQFRDELMDWSAERAAAICGLEPIEICDLALAISEAGATGIRLSMGMQRHAGGGQAARVISCITAVTGDFARRGGGVCYSTSPAYGFDTAALTRPDLLPGPVRARPMTRLGHGLLDLGDPPVKALMIWAANPVVSNPDQGRVREGLERDDLFTVVVDHVHTATTAYADIVLPGTVQTEHDDLHDSFSHLYVNWNNAAVAPAGEALRHTEIFRRLAAAMGVDEPAVYATDDELAESLLGGDHPSVVGIELADLKRDGWARLSGTEAYRPFADGFPTESGRFEFVSRRGEADGVGRLPHYVAPGEVAKLADDELALVSPANHHILNSTFSGSPTHARAGEAVVVVHPADAERLGLADGVEVEVGNERGSFPARLRVSTDARPGVAVTSKGLTPAPSSVNATVAERDSDMGQGAVYHDNAVRIRARV